MGSGANVEPMETDTDRDLSAAVVASIQSGRKITAIKILREETGLGLKEAKHAVEAYQRAHPGPHSASSHSGESSRGGFLLAGALVAAAVAAYYLWN